MLKGLINAPINLFHDKIPKGRIFNRLTRNINYINTYAISSTIGDLIRISGSIFICYHYYKLSIFLIPLVGILSYFFKKYYNQASKYTNMMNNRSSPKTLIILNEIIPGITTIRAFKKEKEYTKKFNTLLDEQYILDRFSRGIYYWMDICTDFLKFIFIAIIVIYAMFNEKYFTSQSISLMFDNIKEAQVSFVNLLWIFTYLQETMLNYSRCIEYINLESEKNLDVTLPKDLEIWPDLGKIEFLNFSVRYRPDTEIVFKNLNFTISGNEKIGVVGRSGSGKSTLSLCLFRILEPFEGKILIDGQDITLVGLRALRMKMTIIPQEPTLFKGTLRYNIDPLNTKTDKEIEDIMKEIGFWYITETNEKGINMLVRIIIKLDIK